MRGTLGTLGNVSDVSLRDAFHVPAVMVTCRVTIQSGQCVRFTDDLFTVVVPCLRFERQAIADPFLHGSVINQGNAFWALPVPELVCGLRHHFDMDLPVDEDGEMDEDEAEERRERDPCDRCDT